MTEVSADPMYCTVDSESWAEATVSASVLVSSWNRAHLLPGLLDALDAQRPPVGGFEVVVVDNGSDDDTFEVLRAFVSRTSLPARAVRLEQNIGPGPARNVAAASARGEMFLVTDDDCIPDRDWVRAVVDAMSGPTSPDLVQGCVRPVDAELATAGPWDHTMRISGPTPWFQTCNIGYRAAAFRSVGGFPVDPLVSAASRRAFGEDTLLGVSIVGDDDRRAYAADALVFHRVVPSTFGAQVRDRRNASGMPGLARHPVVRERLESGMFLGPTSRKFDLALLGVVIALLARRPEALVAGLPWARARWRLARRRRGGPGRKMLALAGWFVVDGVVAASLVEGSVRHRCVLV